MNEVKPPKTPLLSYDVIAMLRVALPSIPEQGISGRTFPCLCMRRVSEFAGSIMDASDMAGPDMNCQGFFHQIHKKFIMRRFFFPADKFTFGLKWDML